MTRTDKLSAMQRKKQLDVLVDYYNLPPKYRNRGPMYWVDSIISAINRDDIGGNRRLRFRIYGGWYDDTQLTRDAQRLVADLMRHFPQSRLLGSSRHSASTIVAELAYGPIWAPSNHIRHTLRSKSTPNGMRVSDTRTTGCLLSDRCPLHPMRAFFEKAACPTPNCAATPKSLLYRRAQKLVDTMLSTDAVFCIHAGATKLAIVSSDDDILPPIMMATHLGVRVFHIHTSPKHSTNDHYTSVLGQNYVQLQLI